MPTVKITLFQKNIHSEINKEDISKIIGQKSQFLLLPDGYPSFKSKSSDSYSEYIDHLLTISESYNGVILSGGIERLAEKRFISLAIINEITLVDFYDKKNPNSTELKEGYEKGSSESIFIMGGLRYGILLSEDIFDESIWEHFKENEIELVIHLTKIPASKSYDQELDFYSNLAKSKKIHIIKVAGITESKGAISLYASPIGINWKVGQSEENKEIIKTLSVNLQGNVFR